MFKAGRISETVRDTAYMLLLVTNKIKTGIRPNRLDGNHSPWMTLTAVTRYCG